MSVMRHRQDGDSTSVLWLTANGTAARGSCPCYDTDKIKCAIEGNQTRTLALTSMYWHDYKANEPKHRAGLRNGGV